MEKSTGKKQYTGLKQRDRFLGAKSLNTNLVQFLPQYHVIISNVHFCSFMGSISNVHGRLPKMVLYANLVYEKL